jgi:hypothetical protein
MMVKRITLALAIALAWCFLAAPAPGQETTKLRPDIQRALKQLKKVEPSIREVQKSALEFFKIDFDTVQSMRTRAGWKSLLPTVGGKYRRNDTEVDLGKWDFINYPDRKAGRDFAGLFVNEFEVSSSWDLSRLVFNPEVLDVASLVVLQEAILKEVTRIYFTRRRLQVDLLLTPPADEATRLSKELRVEELTATLDAMTGGLFSKTMEKRAAKAAESR